MCSTVKARKSFRKLNGSHSGQGRRRASLVLHPEVRAILREVHGPPSTSLDHCLHDRGEPWREIVACDLWWHRLLPAVPSLLRSRVRTSRSSLFLLTYFDFSFVRSLRNSLSIIGDDKTYFSGQRLMLKVLFELYFNLCKIG